MESTANIPENTTTPATNNQATDQPTTKVEKEKLTEVLLSGPYRNQLGKTAAERAKYWMVGVWTKSDLKYSYKMFNFPAALELALKIQKSNMIDFHAQF